MNPSTSSKAFIAIATFITVVIFGITIVGLIGKITNSGLIGICGPYGNRLAIYSMLGIMAVTIASAIMCSFMAVEKYKRSLKFRTSKSVQQSDSSKPTSPAG